MVNFYKVVAVGVLLSVALPTCSGFTFTFDCQVDPRWLRTVHTIDVGPVNSPFVNDVLVNGGAIATADDWIRNYFRFSAPAGVTSFTNKKAVTGHADSTCFQVDQEMANGSVSPTLTDDLTLYIDNWYGAPGVDDALLNTAMKLDWTHPLNAGRRVIFLYAGSVPDEAPTPNMPPFTSTESCEDESAPTTQAVKNVLSDTGTSVIYVVPELLVGLYKVRYSTELVIPQVDDPVLMAEYLLRGLDSMFCLVPPPSVDTNTTSTTSTSTGTSTSTTTSTITETTTSTITETTTSTITETTTSTITETTSSTTTRTLTTTGTSTTTEYIEGYLEIAIALDISYSYNDDIAIFFNAMPYLFGALQGITGLDLHGVGLVSFSDKPFAPFGYPRDYCYREDTALTMNPAVFYGAVSNLRILSGMDWKESQYSVLRSTILSETIGWTPSNTLNGKPVLKIVILATDSLSHTSASAPHLPPVGDDCVTTNYADASDVGDAYYDKVAFPIIVSTPDVYGKWNQKVNDFGVFAPVLNLGNFGSTRSVTDALAKTVKDIFEVRVKQQL